MLGKLTSGRLVEHFSLCFHFPEKIYIRFFLSDVCILHEMFWLRVAKLQDVVQQECERGFIENSGTLCAHLFSSIAFDYETSGLFAFR